MLGVQASALAKFLRRRGLYQRGWVNARQGGTPTGWTTPRGATLAIAHFRAIQGAKVLAGNDPFRARERSRRRMERAAARRAAGAVQAELAAVLSGRSATER